MRCYVFIWDHKVVGVYRSLNGLWAASKGSGWRLRSKETIRRWIRKQGYWTDRMDGYDVEVWRSEIVPIERGRGGSLSFLKR